MAPEIEALLRCPRSKQPLAREAGTYVSPAGFEYPEGDFRVGLDWELDWAKGQAEYERWFENWVAEHDSRPEELDIVDGEASAVYRKLTLDGLVLDVGGYPGLVAHHADVEPERFVTVDPMPLDIEAIVARHPRFGARYPKVTQVSQILGVAEFLPLADASFDTVHMRSCLDHFAAPTVAVLEAFRVCRPGGRLVVGIALEGAYRRPGSLAPADGGSTLYRRGLAAWEARSPATFRPVRRAAQAAKLLPAEDDHHLFHPTYESLRGLLDRCGFEYEGEEWVPSHHNVVYMSARRRERHRD